MIRTPDGTGGSTFAEFAIWTPQAAQITEMEPTIEMIATQENLNQAVKVKVRYNPEVTIELGDKFKWRGFTFNSIRIKVDRIKRMQEIIATSEIETNDREDTTGSLIEWDGGNPNTTFTIDVDGGSV